MNETCDTCRFLDRSEGYGDKFLCRRLPPKGDAWSWVKLTEWCGEHPGICAGRQPAIKQGEDR